MYSVVSGRHSSNSAQPFEGTRGGPVAVLPWWWFNSAVSCPMAADLLLFMLFVQVRAAGRGLTAYSSRKEFPPTNKALHLKQSTALLDTNISPDSTSSGYQSLPCRPALCHAMPWPEPLSIVHETLVHNSSLLLHKLPIICPAAASCSRVAA
jgi:hypothetical protein